MHGPSLATLMVVVLLGGTTTLSADSAGAIAEARGLLARDDAASAVASLEDALIEPGADKAALLDVLRQAYEQAARRSEAGGKAREAETYRENLRILNRGARPTSPPAAAPSEAPALPELAPLPEVRPAPPTSPAPVELPPLVEPPAASAPEAFPAPTQAPGPAPVLPPDPPRETNPAELLPLPAETPAPAPAPKTDLATADAAFVAERYAEAGRLYAELAHERRLPAERRDCWAYCRSVEVVRRINARPKDDREWASIDAEIQQIRQLNPKNWVGEYLRNRAADRPGGRKAATPGRMVVRASSPEEPAAEEAPVRAVANVAPTSPPSRPLQAIGRWQVRETTNFRIYHVDAPLAEQVAKVAETTRVRQTKFWTGAEPQDAWMPKCDLYLYPNGKLYGQMTGQPEDSPGFSTMGMNEGKVIGRRVNIRADHPTAVSAVIPHEITHVILADFFTNQQIPRWADEGMAVLAEPVDEQRRRASDLSDPLASDRLFPIANLMTMDYPDNQYWNLYYAQSVSLTRFLVESGSPAKLVKFLQAAQNGDPEGELRKSYKIDGYADLQKRWLAYARKQASAPAVATPAPGPDLRVR